MEAPESFQGGHRRRGNHQCAAVEKQGRSPGDAFLVEDLLDFSNEEGGLCDGDEVGLEAAPVESTPAAVDSSSSSASEPQFPGEHGISEVGLSDGLSVPYDELAELEWLSHFVEESFSGDDLHRLLLISGAAAKSSSPLSSGGRSELSTEPAAVTLPPEAHVPGKARSKRSRQSSSSTWSSRLLVLSPVTSSDDDGEKEEEAAIGLDGPNGQDGRRCLHCATDKTPQWRAGPMGPKTLCNACGVRFKSGRLVPEYRPAASPTFVPTRHSNSHRKVLELRRQKEIDPPATAARHLHPCGTYQHPPAAAADDFLIHARVGPDFRQLI